MNRTNGLLFTEIHSPFHLEGPFLNPRSLRTLGDHRQQANLTDPMDWIKIDEMERLGRIVLVGPDSTLARLPIRAQAE